MLKKVQEIIKKSYIVFSLISILVILFIINIDHITKNNAILNIFLILFNLMIIIAVNKIIINKIKDSNLNKIIIGLLVLFGVLEIISTYFFRVEYNWDFKWIMDSAKDLATTGTTQNVFYFKIFPNNWAALIIATLGMKITFGNEIGAYVINIISIFFAALFSVLSAKKIGGNKLAVNLMILIVGCAPIYLYSPIIYTDSLSIAFPIATLYFWLLAKENKQKSSKNYICNMIIIGIIGAIGYCIKPVAAIVLIAILIDEIFSNLKFKNIRNLGIIVITFLVIIISFNKLGERYLIRDSKKNDLEFPLTHWIMMGLNKPEAEGGTSIGYGSYSQKDADYTSESGNYEEKKNANLIKIKERLKEFGLQGYIKFLINKFDYVWNDGSYYCLKLIGWDTINKTSVLYKLVLNEEYNMIFNIYMTIFNNCLFFIMILGLIIQIVKKEIKQEMRVLGISIVGIAIFLLLWEARSRYIYFMLPIFCIFSAYEFLELYNYIEKNIREKQRDNRICNKKGN